MGFQNDKEPDQMGLESWSGDGGDGGDGGDPGSADPGLAATRKVAKRRVTVSQHSINEDPREASGATSADFSAFKGIDTGSELIELLRGWPAEFSGHDRDRFALSELLGQGGQGLVFAVDDADCRRQIAMKTLRDSHISVRQTMRFVHEAQVTAQLAHPGIVPVYDLGVLSDGTIFYTMKKVDGESLCDYAEGLAGKPEHRFALLQVFLRVCDAMAFAHAHGVVHRDLKPLNIMVGEFGEVLVLDWGLSKVMDNSPIRTARSSVTDSSVRAEQEPHTDDPRDRLATREGAHIGTIAYMSPEQAQGDNEAIDTRSDIYALGVVLYELLSGASPYPDRPHDRELLDDVARALWRPLHRNRQTEIPAPLIAIVERCLELDPDKRYASLTEVTSDIRNQMAGLAVSAYRESKMESLFRFLRRNATAVRWSAQVALVAIVLGLVWWGVHVHEQEHRRRQLLHSADLAAVERRWSDAIQACEHVLALFPDDVQTVKRRDAMVVQQNQHRAAVLREQRRRSAAQLVSQAEDLLLQEGLVSAGKAVENLTKALALLPTDDDPQEILHRRDAARSRIRRLQALEKLAAAEKQLAAGDLQAAEASLQHVLEGGLADARVDALRTALQDHRSARLHAQQVQRAQDAWGRARQAADKQNYEEAIVELKASIGYTTLPGAPEALEAFTAALVEQRRAAQLDKDRQRADQALAAMHLALAEDELDKAFEHLVQARAAFREHPQLTHASQTLAKRRQHLQELKVADVLKLVDDANQTLSGVNTRLQQIATAVLSVNQEAASSSKEQRQQQRQQKQQLYSEQQKLKRKRLQLLQTLQDLLTKADGILPNHPPALAARAQFYRDRVLEEAAAGNDEQLVVYAALGRAADRAGAFSDIFDGIARVALQEGADALALHALPGAESEQRFVLTAAAQAVPAGRYILKHRSGTVQAVHLKRGQQYQLRLSAQPKLPDHLAFIAAPAGQVLDVPDAAGALRDFVMQTHEVTAQDWCAFLNAAATRRRLRQELAGTARLFPRRTYTDAEGLWHREQGLGGRSTFILETKGSRQAIGPRHPVSGISRDDVLEYISWFRKQTGQAWRLPSAAEWRHAAHSGDQRRFVWGARFEPDACASGIVATANWEHLRVPVGSHHEDRTVHGLYDMAGSVAEFLDSPWTMADVWLVAGGSWRDFATDRFETRAVRAMHRGLVSSGVGFRLVVDIQDGALKPFKPADQ